MPIKRKPRTDPRIIRRLACVAEMAPEAMIVHGAGDADVGTVPALWSNLNGMREDNLNVVVGRHEINHFDSAAIETLVHAHRLFSQCGQRFLLANPRENVLWPSTVIGTGC